LTFFIGIAFLKLVNSVNLAFNLINGTMEEKPLRDRILEISRHLVVKSGYKQLSMRKIARETGVSATSIYLHFDSKDHLLHALIEEAVEDLNNQLESVVDVANNAVERLRMLAEVYINYAIQNPEEYRIIYQVPSEDMQRYPKEKFRKARRGYEIVTTTIEEGVKAGFIEEDEPRIAAYVFWAQLHGTLSVVQSERLDKRIEEQEFLEKSVEHVMNGFKLCTDVHSAV